LKTYIGTKIVEAEPATRGEAWAKINKLDEAETASMIVQMPKDGYHVIYSDGYESWSPKDVFEAAYRSFNAMTFGLAIEAMKHGKKVARAGWNGKGMYVVYRTGYPEGIPANKNTADAIGIPEGTLFKVQPYLQMKCVDGSFQMWLASQSDILAEDWYIVQEAE